MREGWRLGGGAVGMDGRCSFLRKMEVEVCGEGRETRKTQERKGLFCSIFKKLLDFLSCLLSTQRFLDGF